MERKLWKIAGIISAIAVISAAIYLAIANYEMIADYLTGLKEKFGKTCPIKLIRSKCCKDDFDDDFEDFAMEQEAESADFVECVE